MTRDAGHSWLVRLAKTATVAAAAYGVFFFIVMYTPASDWMVKPLFVWPQVTQANAIVLLTSYATPNRILNEEGIWRTLEAARLYRAGTAPVILVSGGRSEGLVGDSSAAMATLLNDLGIPKTAVEFERVSLSTHESAVNVAKLARIRGWTRIALVTDATAMRRARAAFVREGIAVSPAPSMLWELGWEQPYDRLRKFQGALHEYGGLLYYWWQGWI